jgi:glycosyltransferase involved in cell wall biosynthesis
MSALLLVAYQCAPGGGSVSQIGWEWFSQLHRQGEVTLLTHARNRAALAEAPAGCRIEYIDTEWFAGPWYRLARWLLPSSEHAVFLVASLDYFLFDWLAYRHLRRALRAGARWQLVHRVTPVTLAAPTLLGRLGLPLVLGPLNCGLGRPPGFDAVFRREALWLNRLRGVGHLLDRLLGSSARSAAILTATPATLAAVAPRHRGRCRMMSENGVHLERFRATPWPPSPSPSLCQPLRLLFVGRLIALKGVDLLLQALALARAGGAAVDLDVVGEGPLRAHWQALAIRLGLAGCVRFHGAAGVDAVAAHMAACHVLCLPSVRESGGAVLLEAMASARPVIALDYGGPAQIVDDSVGALLPLCSPHQVVQALAAALAAVLADPAAWRARGLAGRARIEQHYSWPAKIAAAGALYQQLLAQHLAHKEKHHV